MKWHRNSHQLAGIWTSDHVPQADSLRSGPGRTRARASARQSPPGNRTTGWQPNLRGCSSWSAYHRDTLRVSNSGSMTVQLRRRWTGIELPLLRPLHEDMSGLHCAGFVIAGIITLYTVILRSRCASHCVCVCGMRGGHHTIWDDQADREISDPM